MEDETELDATHMLQLEEQNTCVNPNGKDDNVENRLTPFSIQLFDSDHLFKTMCQHVTAGDKSVDWRYIMQYSGKNLTHIYDGGYCMSRECWSLAQEFCHELRTINISLTCDNLQAVQSFLPQWQSLEEIALSGPASIEELLMSLSELPRLQKLSLRNFDYTDRECTALNCLTSVTHLEIGCLNYELLNKISELLMHLKSLHIFTMPTMETLRELPAHCGNLENLQLYDAVHGLQRSVPYFPKLESLEIHDQKSSAFIFINHLGLRYNDQLKKLVMPGKHIFASEANRISHLKALTTLSCVLPDMNCLRNLTNMQLQQLSLYDCINMNNVYLLKILRECPSLRFLEVTLCPLINSRCIEKALAILFRNGVTAKQPFELHLTGSSISAVDSTKLYCVPHFNLLKLHLK
ncbi:uncharacterized protein LOC133843503 [Drosophila sulfurigaster albostrigata]|uniref:uncharacterized protein LOC133843503 n=1 Tax=Drosophila sulfurigaster albostrigata TaxID=89887 RepID=UPI002D21B0F3|nr:uncharacterized protein LOC133843503 [Drosophila sulfurigaster albostrigata]